MGGATYALSIPEILDEIAKHSRGSNVHRLASTSRAFARAAVRFDDTMVRTIRGLRDRIESLRAQVRLLDLDRDRLLEGEHEALEDFLSALKQFGPIADNVGGRFDILFFGPAIATAYIIRHLAMHPNDETRATIERISALQHALRTGEPPYGLQERRSPWPARAQTEIQARVRELFKRVKPDSGTMTMTPLWRWWEFDPHEADVFLDLVHEFLPHANEIIATLEESQPRRAELERRSGALRQEMRATPGATDRSDQEDGGS